mmetsp:Transcript_18753/g.30826  ORF Transcript_18753/g.30826 Transcript_18753/m.30826 type:complete len:127 (+) Transcript_18753:3369-3749(+)
MAQSLTPKRKRTSPYQANLPRTSMYMQQMEQQQNHLHSILCNTSQVFPIVNSSPVEICPLAVLPAPQLPLCSAELSPLMQNLCIHTGPRNASYKNSKKYARGFYTVLNAGANENPRLKVVPLNTTI